MRAEKIKISEMFRQLRSRLGITQEKMAESIGVGVRFYSDLESGKKLPSFETMLRARDGLKIPLHQIIGEKVDGPSISQDQLNDIKKTIKDSLTSLERLRPILDLAEDMTDEEVVVLINYARTIVTRRSPQEIERDLKRVRKKRSIG